MRDQPDSIKKNSADFFLFRETSESLYFNNIMQLIILLVCFIWSSESVLKAS